MNPLLGTSRLSAPTLATLAALAALSLPRVCFASDGPAIERPLAAVADARAPLSLPKLLESVERNYPSVIAAVAEQDEARGNLRSAEGGFDPQLKASGTVEPVSGYPKRYLQATLEQPTSAWGATLFAGYRYGTGTFPAYDGKLETNDLGEVRGGVRVPLLRDGAIDRRRAALRQAELGVEMARLGAEQQRIEVRRLATLRYWEWVAAGARLEVVRGWLELARRRDAALVARVAQGDAPEIEVAENRRTVLQREGAVVAAERDAELAAIEVSLFLRGEDGRPRVPDARERPSTLPEPVPVAALRSDAEALAARPDVRRLELQRSRSEVEVELARNQAQPAVDVSAVGSKDLGPGDAKRGMPVLELSLSVDIPLLNRVQTGRADAARAGVRKASEQLRLARDRAAADLRAANASLEAARPRVRLATEELEVARTLAEAELRRFELGESNLLLVNLREQASAEAQLRRVDVLADFQRGLATLRAALARNGADDAR